MKKWLVLTMDCRTGEYIQRLLPAKTERQASDRVKNDRIAVIDIWRFEGKRANKYIAEQRDLYPKTREEFRHDNRNHKKVR